MFSLLLLKNIWTLLLNHCARKFFGCIFEFTLFVLLLQLKQQGRSSAVFSLSWLVCIVRVCQSWRTSSFHLTFQTWETSLQSGSLLPAAERILFESSQENICWKQSVFMNSCLLHMNGFCVQLVQDIRNKLRFLLHMKLLQHISWVKQVKHAARSLFWKTDFGGVEASRILRVKRKNLILSHI